MPLVCSMSQPRPSSSLDSLIREVSEFRKQFERLASERNCRSHTRSARTSGHRSLSRSKRLYSNYRKYPLCWYHNKYGEKANKCVLPCDLKEGNAGRSVMTTNDCPPSSTGRLFNTDRASKVQFLIDTGSDLCVYTRSMLRDRIARTNL